MDLSDIFHGVAIAVVAALLITAIVESLQPRPESSMPHHRQVFTSAIIHSDTGAGDE